MTKTYHKNFEAIFVGEQFLCLLLVGELVEVSVGGEGDGAPRAFGLLLLEVEVPAVLAAVLLDEVLQLTHRVTHNLNSVIYHTYVYTTECVVITITFITKARDWALPYNKTLVDLYITNITLNYQFTNPAYLIEREGCESVNAEHLPEGVLVGEVIHVAIEHGLDHVEEGGVVVRRRQPVLWFQPQSRSSRFLIIYIYII